MSPAVIRFTKWPWKMTLHIVLLTAGASQLALAVASLAIPRVLNWRAETKKLDPLTRAVFWTYAGYIWGTNVAFGSLSMVVPSWLLDGTPLARAVSGFIALYWGTRVVIQLVVFGKHAPRGRMFRMAERGMVVLFVLLTLAYACVVFKATGGG